jgi:hypothetical protein
MLVLVLLLCLVMAGCGAVGQPLPPLLDIPQPATALTAVQRGEHVLVTWPAPTLSTEAVTVRPAKLGPQRLYRVVLPGLMRNVSDQDYKSHPSEVIKVEVGKVEYDERIDPSWEGKTVAYALEMPNRRGESAGPSNLAVVAILRPPGAPQISAHVLEPAVVLDWSAQEGAAYRVYRDGQFKATVTGGHYEDQEFEFGTEYRYMVRGFVQSGDFSAESSDSNTLTVKPEDTFPPLPPRGLTAIAVEAGVDLSWSPNSEGDLAGYNVYRGTVQVNKQLLLSTTFHDDKPGPSPRYTITAVDRRGNESKPSAEAAP